MSAHVATIKQDDTTEELPENFSQKLIIPSRVHTQRRLTAMLSPTNQRAESKGNRWHPRDVIVVCAVQTRPSTESRALLTNQIRTWFVVVVLFYSSFTRSERFLHTDQLITRLRRVEPDFKLWS